MTFTSTHQEAVVAAMLAGPSDMFVRRGDVLARASISSVDVERIVATYLDALGAKIVPAHPSIEWSEKYCELTNRHPDGMQSTSSHDCWTHTTFREMAGREISAMLSASPDPFTDEAAVAKGE